MDRIVRILAIVLLTMNGVDLVDPNLLVFDRNLLYMAECLLLAASWNERGDEDEGEGDDQSE